MKKIIIICIIVFYPILVIGQTSSENYIQSTTYKVATPNSITNPLASDATVNITYYDGLGRPKQKIACMQSGTGKNLITPIEYDDFGRQVKEYLPYAVTGTGLDYITTAINDQPNFSLFSGETSYSQKSFESSPLNRVIEQAAPGNDWSLNNSTKHTIRLDYQTNITTDAVKLFSIIATWDAVKGLYDIPTSLTATTYADFQLYKTITKNENWITADGNNNTIEEFIDKEGRLVHKRTYDNNIAHNTYYVYDQYGNLTYVIPPLVDNTIVLSSSVLDGLCYQYRYDYRNRLVEKKLPGKQWEFIVYDRLNRVVATGPAFAPFSDLLVAPAKIGWMITKYDAFNRPTYTGWKQATSIATADRKLLQDAQNALTTTLNETKTTSGTIDGISVYYSNNVAPTSFKLLTVNYYDDYSFPNAPTTIPAYVMNDNSQPVFYNASTKPKGLPTGTWIRIPELSTTTPVKSETNYLLYDNKARAVRSATTNYLTGYTQADSKIDFTGKVLYTETKHKRLSTDPIELFVKEAYTYSDQDRLLTHTHQIGTAGTPQLIAKNTYNELGQLITKNVGGTNTTSTAIGLQKVDYSYNIRGWLKGINDVTDLKTSTENDLFAFKLNYNVVDNAPNSNCKALFNGNISETYWRTNSDNIKRKYSFEYDNLNRLKNAIYQKPDMATAPTNSYNESMQYDKNGNIVALQRNGDYDDAVYPLQIDNLNYSYDTTNNTPNKLLKVTDLTNDPTGFKDGTNSNDDFVYDANGNMTSDQNKGITSIKYNHLNLPTEIIFNNLATKKITYLYDSNGTKKQKIFTNGTVVTTTDYLDGFQYTKTGSAAVLLKYFPTSEGYVSVTVSGGVNTYNYVYNYTDHLGNVRVSYGYGANKSGIYGTYILLENNYYPFGLSHTNYNTTKLVYEDNVANGIAGTISAPPLNYTLNKYKYNGKELQDELSLNLYDYGARNYDPALGRWMNIDPLAEKHFDISPYVYCMNNPVVFVDPDGRDFGLYIDFEKGTVTIRATYYTTNQDKNSATNATKSWNDKSGKFSFKYTDENGNKQNLKVNYELNVEVVTPSEGQTEMGALNQALSANTSGEGNVYKVVDDNKLDENTNGSTSQNFIQIKNSKRDAETGAHEIGHSLGLIHSEKGLMTASSIDPNRSKDVYSDNVSNTLNSVGSNINNPNNVNNPIESGAGRATLHLQGTSNPRAPQTDKGYRKLRNGTVK
jgi:RHS repeat-associated protein